MMTNNEKTRQERKEKNLKRDDSAGPRLPPVGEEGTWLPS